MISATILSNLKKTLTTVYPTCMLFNFLRDMLCDSYDATERKALERRETYPEVIFWKSFSNGSHVLFSYPLRRGAQLALAQLIVQYNEVSFLSHSRV